MAWSHAGRSAPCPDNNPPPPTPPAKDVTFDLVVSGINRGDNCGLHVVYSGTVGAAREAACKVGRLLGGRCGVESGAWARVNAQGASGQGRDRNMQLGGARRPAQASCAPRSCAPWANVLPWPPPSSPLPRHALHPQRASQPWRCHLTTTRHGGRMTTRLQQRSVRPWSRCGGAVRSVVAGTTSGRLPFACPALAAACSLLLGHAARTRPAQQGQPV
jgi:hypothetical protein